jgi:hypothetical protein
MANGDHENVGMTLLRIDKGVDTGPVFGHFRITPDPSESHVVTEHRAALEHLDRVASVLRDVAAGRAQPIDTKGRPSAAWGQPWLSVYIRMRLARPPRAQARVAAFALSALRRASPKLAELRPERRRET